jgi:ribosomal protein L7/L12
MATNNLLNQPTPNYRRFVDNQVLTDNQLNAVLDYLNHQDRLSRLLLHGVGIVCGLNVSSEGSGSKIRLSKGVAVTTAGDLLNMGEKVYQGFKKFDDANVKYPFFLKGETDSVSLWALSEDHSPSDVHPLSQFRSKTDMKLRDAVAVLYLEDYLDEEKDCSAVDCDTQGQPVVNRLRVLLVNQDDAEQIVTQDSLLSGFVRKGKQSSGWDSVQHFAPRIILNRVNTRSFSEFKKEYQVSFEALAEKIESLSEIGIFEKTLSNAGIDPVDELLQLSPQKYNFQYHYDFYRDLTTAYNELSEAFGERIGLCSPDPDAFPKHVLLGKIDENQQEYRHSFYPSPVHDSSLLGDVIRLYERILLMIRNFDDGQKNEIKITPSKGDHYSLGERSVPSYYQVGKNKGDFLKTWAANSTKLVLNYEEANYPYEDFDPLDVVLDGHNFYRVEGHAGKNVREVQKKIQTIRETKGLSFDIKPVAVGRYPEETLVDFNKYRIHFEDLQVVLEAWNEEQQCMIRSASAFLSGFSIKKPGTHTAYSPPEKREDVNEDTSDTGGNNFTGMVYEPIFTPLNVMAKTYYQPKKKTSGAKKISKNQSIKSFSKVQESSGYALLNKIKPSDSKNDVTIKFLDLLPTTVINWQTDIREATINIPAEIIGHLKEVEDYKLIDIGEFSDNNLNSFLKALHDLSNQASSAINRLQHMIAKDESEIKGKIWLDDYLHLLNRIASSRCLIEKIKVLYETIIERKAELFSELTLNSFIEKHAGAEHKAGVERGGTLILLYYSKNTGPSNQQQLIQQLQLLKGRESGAEMKMHHGLSIADANEAEAVYGIERYLRPGEYIENIPDSFINVNVGEWFRKPLEDEPQHGDVIGDLCLPYICCSDTPSVTFVFPDQLATLRIPVDHVCVDENGGADPIALNVMPAGGTVKAYVGQNELNDVISEKENGLFFNPNKVDRDLYGESIRFEVNGQAVEPTLHIVRKPKAAFKISDQVTFERNNSGAVLLIKNESVPFDELKFEWNIDGHRVTNENATEFKYPIKVRPGQNLSVRVKLTAFNEYCSDTHQDTIEIDVPGGQRPNDPDRPGPNEPDEKVDLILTAVGDKKIAVIKEIRVITGLGLRESKELVDNVPSTVVEGVSVQKAKEFATMLRQAGAKVKVKQ